MTRAPLIVSVGIADARLNDPAWAAKIVALASTARVALLLLGDGGAAGFDSIAIGKSMAPGAGGIAFVPTVDTGFDNPLTVAPSLVELDRLASGNAGWQPTTLVQPHTAQSLADGVDFVAATHALWAEHERPMLVQSDADPLWSRISPDIVVIDRDSPAPKAGPKVLLRTFTAMAGLDQIEALYLEGVIDGIHLTPPDMEEGLKAFAETMLPALIARGLVLAAEPEGSLRARLGIA